MADVEQTTDELGGYFLDIKGVPLCPDEGDAAGAGLVAPEEDLKLGRIRRVPPAPPYGTEVTAGQQDRASFNEVRRRLLQSRDSPHGFVFQTDA
eukprot:11702218-Alexandrium_andersonii.AAC.1